MDALRRADISDSPAEWMRAEPSGSMAKFPKARAARFWTVSRATFLFRISTKTGKNVSERKRHELKASAAFFTIYKDYSKFESK